MEIRNGRLKGMSCTELGRKYNVDPRAAKRYAESPARPEYTPTGKKPTKRIQTPGGCVAGRCTILSGTDTGKADGTGL
ncbi:MAG: hypothetical protein FWE59_04655, partial [Oscillospiraceae bacterium]|nr:hypothetical protein [Oscillospiraceae bacterium]